RPVLRRRRAEAGIAGCGHTSRTQRAFDLSREIGAGLVLDDGTVGSNANHDRAWRYAASGGSQWSIVVEDDAVPIAEFGVHAIQMLKSLRGAPGGGSCYMGAAAPGVEERRVGGAGAGDGPG